MNKTIFRFNTSPLTAAGLAFALALTLLAPAVRASTPFLSNTEVQALTGKSIAEWGAEWWQWAFQHPEVLGDRTGKSGLLGDVDAHVFFAEGSGGHPVNVKYTVPGDKYVLIPVATYIWTFFAPCAEKGCATEIVNNVLAGVTDAYLIVDGLPVPDMSAHLVLVDSSTVPFKVDAGPIDPDNGYGGILDALQAGYWVMLSPLSPGSHLISFGATAPSIDGSTGELLGGSFDLKAKLRLEVAIPK